eukprot:Amastigsp_a1719_104.p1 type:complete len:204 gc:universal Amastigsp_a1719_104:805-1416(+)
MTRLARGPSSRWIEQQMLQCCHSAVEAAATRGLTLTSMGPDAARSAASSQVHKHRSRGTPLESTHASETVSLRLRSTGPSLQNPRAHEIQVRRKHACLVPGPRPAQQFFCLPPSPQSQPTAATLRTLLNASHRRESARSPCSGPHEADRSIDRSMCVRTPPRGRMLLRLPNATRERPSGAPCALVRERKSPSTQTAVEGVPSK